MLGASGSALTVVSPTHSHMWYSSYSIGSWVNVLFSDTSVVVGIGGKGATQV
jgi:hypothetical protein